MPNITYEVTKGSDKFTVTILEDGTIRTETSKVSAPNHQSAEAFLLDIAKLTGGKRTTTNIGHGHHHHGHGHSHEQEHKH